jgi:hypothetical protein
MRRADPPAVATWLVEHVARRYRRESLAGDLLEEYRAGRSSAWYWRQVLCSLIAAAGHVLRTRAATAPAVRGVLGLALVCAFVREHPLVLLLALDPSSYWLYSAMRKRRRRQRECVR